MDESTLTGSEINDSLLTISDCVSDVEQLEAEFNKINMNDVISQICKLFNGIVLTNKSNGYSSKYDYFYTTGIPKISFEEFVRNLVSFNQLETTTLICSVIYIDQFCLNLNYVLSFHNCANSLCTSLCRNLRHIIIEESSIISNC